MYLAPSPPAGTKRTAMGLNILVRKLISKGWNETFGFPYLRTEDVEFWDSSKRGGDRTFTERILDDCRCLVEDEHDPGSRTLIRPNDPAAIRAWVISTDKIPVGNKERFTAVLSLMEDDPSLWFEFCP